MKHILIISAILLLFWGGQDGHAKIIKVSGKKTLTIRYDQFEFRDTPQKRNDNLLGTLKKGSEIIWMGYRSGNWLKVRAPNGQVGWVHNSGVSGFVESTPTSAIRSSRKPPVQAATPLPAVKQPTSTPTPVQAKVQAVRKTPATQKKNQSKKSEFDLRGYYAVHSNQDKNQFLERFPYNEYLKNVSFVDFRTLQQHREYLQGTHLRDGDEFLYYLGEYFIRHYPATLSNIEQKVTIGEAYINPKKGILTSENELYQVIGFYVLGNVGQTLEKAIRKGSFQPQFEQNIAIIERLRKNKVYVTLERGAIDKLMEALKNKNWEYVTDRGWAMSQQILQELGTHYSALLGDGFFEDFFGIFSGEEALIAGQSNFKLKEYKNFYPIGEQEYKMDIFQVRKRSTSEFLGHVIWLRRPYLKAKYFAYQNVSQKYSKLAKRGGVVLATTGGFTNRDKQPEGLTVEKGNIVNAVLMPDRHGLVIVHDSGGISVINLKRKTIKLSLNSTESLEIENPLQSLSAYSKLLHWCKEKKATLFQTQLLAYSNAMLIEEGKAKSELRERRILALVRNTQSNVLHHIIFNLPSKHSLYDVAKEVYTLLARRNKKIEAILNLDVGAYDIINVFDPTNGKALSDIRSRWDKDIRIATNLIVYTL